MKSAKKWASLVLVAGSTLFASTCSTQMRDAVVTAGADFVGETTARFLEAFVPADLLLPAEP